MLPGIRSWISSPNGIKRAIYFGVSQKDQLTEQTIQHYQAPFAEKIARKALLKAVQRLSIKGFHEIAEKLPQFKGPVQIIYGENDKILPKVQETMEKVKKDLPQAEINALPECGHFLQEDAPSQISQLILEFMDRMDRML